MHSNHKPASGFTLLELIVIIGIIGILMAIAIPTFKDLIRNNRLTTYANELITSMNLARSEAIKRGAPVTISKVSTGTSSLWSASGWNVFVDTDGNGVRNTASGSTETIIKSYPGLPSPYTLMSNNFPNYITYKRDGTSNTNGSFAVCDNNDGNNKPEPHTSKLIIVNKTGRTQMGKDTNNDGVPEKNDTSHTPLSDCISP
jgi:type IV fimbrial biogenesis protein FimT